MKTKEIAVVAGFDAEAEMKTLPPMRMSQAEFAEELRKTIKNVSARPTLEQAKLLIYLESECSIPKATAVKACLDMSLGEVCRRIQGRLAELDALTSKEDPMEASRRMIKKRLASHSQVFDALKGKAGQ